MKSTFIPLVLLATACASEPAAQAPQYWVDMVRRPNGDARGEPAFSMAQGRCRAQAMPIYAAGAYAPPGMMRMAADNAMTTFINCMAGEGFVQVASASEHAAMVDRLRQEAIARSAQTQPAPQPTKGAGR